MRFINLLSFFTIETQRGSAIPAAASLGHHSEVGAVVAAVVAVGLGTGVGVGGLGGAGCLWGQVGGRHCTKSHDVGNTIWCRLFPARFFYSFLL